MQYALDNTFHRMGYAEHAPDRSHSRGRCLVFVCTRGDGPVTTILEWFHIAMRVHHLKQLARGLSTRVPTHAAAAANRQEELDRLPWRLWHGRTDAVDVSLHRLKTAIQAFSKSQRQRPRSDASRQ